MNSISRLTYLATSLGLFAMIVASSFVLHDMRCQVIELEHEVTVLQTETAALQVEVEKLREELLPVVPEDFWTSNYEQVTGLSAVQTLTVPAGATGAIIQAEDQGLRLRYDGTDPDASTGLQIIAGDYLVIEPGMIPLGNIELIEETATAKANVLYLR